MYLIDEGPILYPHLAHIYLEGYAKCTIAMRGRDELDARSCCFSIEELKLRPETWMKCVFPRLVKTGSRNLKLLHNNCS